MVMNSLSLPLIEAETEAVSYSHDESYQSNLVETFHEPEIGFVWEFQ